MARWVNIHQSISHMWGFGWWFTKFIIHVLPSLRSFNELYFYHNVEINTYTRGSTSSRHFLIPRADWSAGFYIHVRIHIVASMCRRRSRYRPWQSERLLSIYLMAMLDRWRKKKTNPRRSSVPEEEKKRIGKQTAISIWCKVKHIDDFIQIRDNPSIRYPYAEFFKCVRKGAYWGCFTKKNGTGWFQKCEDR